jgi:hypothetical protein
VVLVVFTKYVTFFREKQLKPSLKEIKANMKCYHILDVTNRDSGAGCVKVATRQAVHLLSLSLIRAMRSTGILLCEAVGYRRPEAT